MADLKSATTYRTSTKWANGHFELRIVPTCSDTRSKDFGMTEELFWIAYRPRQNGGQPEDTPRRWSAIEGEERQALLPIFDAWQKGIDAPVEGTPLRSWAGMVPSLLDGLLKSGINTVERLADTSEAVVAGCGVGCLALQVKAREYVKNSTADHLARAENAALKAQLEELQAQISALSDSGDSGTMSDKPRRGRPPKQEAA